MKKSYLVILLAITLGAGTALGAFITRYVWQTNMTMRLTGSLTYDLELRYLNGTPITDYNWGNFSFGETKYFDCNLEYLGNATSYVYWNTTDLPLGWIVDVYDLYDSWSWTENWMSLSVFYAGETHPLTIYLTAPIGGELNQPLSFTLNFVSGEETA
ncbi:hypothetical protein KAS06_01585 [Candidatus Bathyarchaeota archaeon]|nr:hypothetical protein [Candidatus Bathyarchaeota archaeon]